MKKLIFAILLVGLASCAPKCPCEVSNVKLINKESAKYEIQYSDPAGNVGKFFSDSAYQINQIILY